MLTVKILKIKKQILLSMHKTSNNSTYNIVINNLQNYMLTNDNINIISKKHMMFLKLTMTTMNRNKAIAKRNFIRISYDLVPLIRQSSIYGQSPQ